MFKFDPQPYGEAFAEVIDADRLCELGAGQPNTALQKKLEELSTAKAFGDQEIVDPDAANCCLAAVWLLNDFLAESHNLSQESKTADGAYWHALMHRREQDYNNAKYWFKEAGTHSIYVDLAAEARQMAESEPPTLEERSGFLADELSWDPYRFVDLCQRVASGQSEAGDLCRRVARVEWQLLFHYCYRKALGLESAAAG